MEKTIKLKHNSKKFPLVISEKLERKIRVLCNKFPSTEWSGILFYTYKGSFKEGDIEFVAEDLLFKDTGNGAATEFYLDEGNTAEYIADHELWDCQCGILHSHHGMQAYFSGQDESMLLQEGKSRNHFLSLVVNNEGSYVAKITVKEIYELDIKSKIVYKTFNDVITEQEAPDTHDTVTNVSTYDLDIRKEYEFTCDDYEELMQTISECNKIKEERKERDKAKSQFLPFYSNNEKIPTLFPEFPNKTFKDNIDYKTNVSAKKVLNDKEVEYYVCQLLTLSPLNMSYNDISSIKDINIKLHQRFSDTKNYGTALDSFTDYLLYSDLYEYLDIIDDNGYPEDKYSIAINQISDGIKKYTKSNQSNDYIQVLLERLAAAAETF